MRDLGCFEMNVSDFYESHRFIKKDNQLIIYFQYDYCVLTICAK